MVEKLPDSQAASEYVHDRAEPAQRPCVVHHIRHTRAVHVPMRLRTDQMAVPPVAEGPSHLQIAEMMVREIVIDECQPAQPNRRQRHRTEAQENARAAACRMRAASTIRRLQFQAVNASILPRRHQPGQVQRIREESKHAIYREGNPLLAGEREVLPSLLFECRSPAGCRSSAGHRGSVAAESRPCARSDVAVRGVAGNRPPTVCVPIYVYASRGTLPGTTCTVFCPDRIAARGMV